MDGRAVRVFEGFGDLLRAVGRAVDAVEGSAGEREALDALTRAVVELRARGRVMGWEGMVEVSVWDGDGRAEGWAWHPRPCDSWGMGVEVERGRPSPTAAVEALFSGLGAVMVEVARGRGGADEVTGTWEVLGAGGAVEVVACVEVGAALDRVDVHGAEGPRLERARAWGDSASCCGLGAMKRELRAVLTRARDFDTDTDTDQPLTVEVIQ